MSKQKLQSRQEKKKEKFEKKARKKKEEEITKKEDKTEKKKEAKKEEKKKIKIKKPVVSEAKSHGEYLSISPKISVEVARAIRGKDVKKAFIILDGAINLERPIRYYRYNKETPHRKGKGFSAGRYPVKVCKAIKNLLENAVANAKYLNLDVEKLYVKSAIANRAVARERQGRYTHFDLIVAEKRSKPKVNK